MQQGRKIRLRDGTVLVELVEDLADHRGDYVVLEQYEVSELHYNAALGMAVRERTDELIDVVRKRIFERSNFDDVGDFHEKFDLANVTHHEVGPIDMPPDLLDFRLKFLQEELDEFAEATEAGDLPKAFDALLDLVYVAMGTAHLFGFPWQKGWDLVQKANMSKLRATTGMVGPRGDIKYDVIKGPDFQPPDIEGLLCKHGWPPMEVAAHGCSSDDAGYAHSDPLEPED